MAHKMGYWVDLAKVELNESDGPSRILAMPLGKYTHPVFGEIDITPERVQRFADNVNAKVRETDLDIDYDHKRFSGEAAGWVVAASATPAGLALDVNWTDRAKKAIKEKAYRYFSPEFADEWQHPKSGKTFKDVLFGGGITNRPFLKDILPINMSEIFEASAELGEPTPTPAPKEEEKGMDLKKVREALGLSETATEEDFVAAIAKLSEPKTAPTPTPPPAPEPPKYSIEGKSVEQVLAELSDVRDNPGIRSLTEMVKAQQETIKRLDDARRKVEIERKLDELDDLGKGVKVPPAVKEQLRDIMFRSDPALGEQVYDAYASTLKLGVIDMSERGWQRKAGDLTPAQRFDAAVADLQKANPTLNFGEAVTLVASQQPQLYDEYRQDQYISREL